MVRYSREDALTQREFVLLLEGARKLKEPFDLQARFIIMASGKMGMRGGEIAHIDESWVNFSEGMISIPEYQNCTNGRHGDKICGYCRNRIKDYIDTHVLKFEEAMESVNDEFGDELDEKSKESIAQKRVDKSKVSFEDLESEWWQPKTPAAIRSIPFDFDTRLQLTVERFFEKYDSFPVSKATLNRRVDRAVESSDLNKRVYPHSLRATAATTHASRDVSPYALMSTMGWRDLDTARTYISASDESAAIEIRSKH